MSTNLSYDIAWYSREDHDRGLEKQFRPVTSTVQSEQQQNHMRTSSIPPSALQPKQRRQKHQWNDPILRDKSHQTHSHKLAISQPVPGVHIIPYLIAWN